MTARPRRQYRPDQLATPGLTSEELAVSYAVAPFDRAMTAADHKWGVNRLVALVSPVTAAKFGSAMVKLNAATLSGDITEITGRVGVCLRGIAAMEAEAIAAGHQPASPDMWECTVDGKPAVLIRDPDMWPQAQAAHPGKRIWAIGEIENALAHYGSLVAQVKDTFAGATVTAIRKPTALEKQLEDQIPW